MLHRYASRWQQASFLVIEWLTKTISWKYWFVTVAGTRNDLSSALLSSVLIDGAKQGEGMANTGSKM